MSSTLSIATPALPTSPRARGESESSPICVGRSNATDSPVCPAASRCRKRSLVWRGRAEAGVLPHRPQAAAVHVGLDAAREWKNAGIAQRCCVVTRRLLRPVGRLYGNPRRRSLFGGLAAVAHRAARGRSSVGTPASIAFAMSTSPFAPDVKRRPLVKIGGLEIENSVAPVDCRASRLLDDEGQRIGLVKETKLSARLLLIRRIGEQTAAEKIAVEIGDERADVADVHRRSLAVQSAIAPHQRPNVLVPETLIRVVDGKVPA